MWINPRLSLTKFCLVSSSSPKAFFLYVRRPNSHPAFTSPYVGYDERVFLHCKSTVKDVTCVR